jgi:hypothetical protein
MSRGCRISEERERESLTEILRKNLKLGKFLYLGADGGDYIERNFTESV